MPDSFTFLQSNFESIFTLETPFLPGIEKIGGIFYSPYQQELRVVLKDKKGQVHQVHELLEKRESVVRIQKLRGSSQVYEWYRRDELPFEITPSKNDPPDLFSELESIVLVLRYRNEMDNKYDLLFLYLNPNVSSFGLSREGQVLSVENKTIIGHILYHFFLSVLSISRQNRSILTSLQQNVRAVVRENVSLKEESLQTLANFGDSMVNLCQQHLQEASENNDRTYQLSEEAARKLKTFKGNVRHLESIVRNAVIFTENLLPADFNDQIVTIQAYALNFDDYQVAPTLERSLKRIDSRESRSIQLLDRLEKAAVLLKSKNMSLTSANVGKTMPQQITAPAITDALKKNRRSVLLALDKYPDKWETIRQDFKPLRNILKKDLDEDKQEEESA